MSTLKVQFSFLGFSLERRFFPKISRTGTFATKLKHLTDLEKDCVGKEFPPIDKQRWGRQEKGSQTQTSQAKKMEGKARPEKAYHRVS